ncbi:MAG: hypothetical protein RL095_3188 [Verrucomicrobiota bacterium]
MKKIFCAAFAGLGLLALDTRTEEAVPPTQAPKTHSFITFGHETAIRSFKPGGPAEGEVVWRSKLNTREGWVLADGHILLAVTRGQPGFPGGGVVEMTRDGKTVWEYKGAQDEVNSCQKTPEGNYVLTEAGPKPRLLEIDPAGKVLVEFPLACQKGNAHMQTRMARKAADGTYWVPHLLDFAIKHYDVRGQVLGQIDTSVPGDAKRQQHAWPFTAVLLPNGHLLTSLTHGHSIAEFDAQGRKVWEVSNAELGGIIKDACALQRLPDGNTVVTSYAAGKGEVNLWEVTRDKKLVWSWKGPGGVHSFQILDTDGQALEGVPLR